MTSRAKKTLAFGVGIVLLVIALTIVSRSTQPPRLPADNDHRGLSSNASCRPCHGEGSPSPLKPGHPPKDDCVHCHRAEAR
jgi:hypothetical protein